MVRQALICINSRSVGNFIPTLLSVAIAIPLILSGMVHLGNPVQLLTSIVKYELAIPFGTQRLIAVWLPLLQLVVGAAVLANPRNLASYLIVIFLSLCFVVAQASVLYRGLNIDCGCFGDLRKVNVGRESLLLAVALLTLSASGYWWCKRWSR